MNPEISLLPECRRAAHSAHLLHATPRGARLARLLTVRFLAERGWPPTCDAGASAASVAAELAANAATHGRVRGRGFRLALVLDPSDTLRIEVTDPRGNRLPTPYHASATAESGRGLHLVAALATAWGVTAYPPSGKTVWATLPLTSG